MFFGVFSMQQVHAANVMEGIFKGMVASTDPASVRTASRVGAVGGSFSYRQPQVNTNLVNVSFPKASVGCNGIDIFLGSFSMINGDQLVQIGRGIAQGSAVYAFNTAVSAICADCAAIIANIQDKLAALNKFAKDSCNAAYEFLQNGLGTPQEFTEKIGLGGGAVDSMVSGIFPDFGSTMSQPASEVNKKNYAKDPDAFKEKYAGNIVYQGFMSIDNGNMNVGGVTELTGYKLAEQIMSLTGTLIVSWDSNGENSAITPIPPTMKAADFIKGTGSGNVKLNVCNPTPDLRSNRKAQCLEMRQDSIQFKGLSETIIETLLEIQRAVRNDTELTQDQRKLISILLYGLITDWRAAFDPLTPVGQVSDTLDDSLTLGPMTKMVKYMEWGGESSGFCQAFPNTMSGSEKPVTFDVCRIIQSIARDCIKTTQDSEVNTPLRGVALNEIYATDLASVMNVMDSMTANSLKTASVPMVTSTGLQYASCTDAWAAVKAAFDSPHPPLAGSAIVIASSNNGAVENISLELPGMEAVPEDVSDRSDYFGGLATVLLNRPAWGLLAARLGNKSNREQFVNTLWWGNSL